MRKLWFVILLWFAGGWCIQAQPAYQPAPENLKAREWFQDARFGLFIHWGIYSVMGDGEWVMRTRSIPARDYEKLASFFYPYAYNPAEWVQMAKKAGMKYITITARHHDGFSMFDSKVSDYNIVKKTPYQKDVLKMLAEECRKDGIKLFFYYSHLDWWHPDYYPRGTSAFNSGQTDWTGRPKGDWDKYIAYMNALLTELLTNYDDVAGIWFDGWWDHKDAVDWKFSEQYALIHSLQPACLIGNNHHQAPIAGEDFQMFEKDLPGHNTSGFSGEAQIGALPLEMCETMNDSWGFQIKDRKFKSSAELIGLLVKSAGYNSNLLLNVGPMPDGRIQQECADTLALMGQWLERYGESIYGTRAGPVSPRHWGVTTAKGNKVYVHILDYQDKTLVLPWSSQKVRSARCLNTNGAVSIRQEKDQLLIELPRRAPQTVDLIIELSTL